MARNREASRDLAHTYKQVELPAVKPKFYRIPARHIVWFGKTD